jgi:UDP-glucose:(heptosyl)LPS alpha-1,3-glucosyltransferase
MRHLRNAKLKLLVVGGGAGVVSEYRKRAAQSGLRDAVCFVGCQPDVRPYLWSSDALIFPSAYEAASLAFYEAAAAGLPLLSCRLNGTEDVLIDGRTGFVMMPSGESVAAALDRFLGLGETMRQQMGIEACRAAQAFDVKGWTDRWRTVYSEDPRLRLCEAGAGKTTGRAAHVV